MTLHYVVVLAAALTALVAGALTLLFLWAGALLPATIIAVVGAFVVIVCFDGYQEVRPQNYPE